MTISGDAKFGVDYTSKPGEMKSKHMFKHEMGVDFTGSGTTDGGLTFGGKAGFDTEDTDLNEGTVFISGSFGTITFGNNDSADLLAGGIADVGLNGVGVDDVAEDFRGSTLNQFRYDQSFGNIALALSAGTGPIREGRETLNWRFGPPDRKNHYAIGMNFSASGATVGLGYDSKRTVSAGIGYSSGQIAANAFYTKRDETWLHLGPQGDDVSNPVPFTVSKTGLGMDMSYTLGASTLTLVYTKAEFGNVQPFAANGAVHFRDVSLKGLGVGFSHDLGGGAKLVVGFAKVPQDEVGKIGNREDLTASQLGQTFDRPAVTPVAVAPFNADGRGSDDDSDVRADDRYMFNDKNVASIGVSFSF